MRLGVLLGVLAGALAFTAPAGAADPLRPYQWGLTMMGADAARATSTGAGATVAVIDTGAALAHPDLQGRLVAGRDFVDGDSSPDDGDGHGTHVAGVVAANAGNGIGVEGIAPGARVLVVRVLGDDGSGSMSNVAAGVQWATDNGADVINLSLGPEAPLVGGSREFDAAIGRALDRGLVVVAAAGNGAFGQGVPLPVCDQPSGRGRLLCVGAVDRRGERAFYSNFGDGLGITAPGGAAVGPVTEDILSTVPSPSGSEAYGWMAGTSQATPHVAAVAALLVSLGVRGGAATERILRTARDAGSPGPDAIYGAGIVDARAAVAGLSPAGGGGGAPPATSPSTTGAAARISLARVHRLRTVLRRGIRVRCRAAGSGRCAVRVNARRRRIARASRAVRVGRTVVVAARLTRRGRRLALSALRARRRFRASVYVSLPGVRTQRRTILLRP